MKRMTICFLLATVSCLAQDVVKFSGKITNPNSDKIKITGNGVKQLIPVAKDGTFSSSFAAPEGIYEFYDGSEYTTLYLKNGFDLNMTLDTAQFDETIVYKGKGANENNLLAANALEEEKLGEKLQGLRDQVALQKILDDYGKSWNTKLNASGIDPGLKTALAVKAKADAAAQETQMKEMMDAKAAVTAKFAGKPSPDFNYENYKGGKTKLADFKGKYVYIDNWATWCGPCR